MSDLLLYLDITRFIIGFSILAYASYIDLKTRRAPNILWLIMGGVGGILLVIHFLVNGFGNQIVYLIFIPIMIGLMYLFFQLRLIFGGADAKAIMALAILTPVFPFMNIATYPIFTSMMPFSWVIFSNSILLFLFIPISLCFFNITKKTIQFPHCFIGYKTSIEKARHTFVWPLERIIDGKLRFSYVPHAFDASSQLEVFEKKGFNTIWVTPKIPFMIPLLAGFITAFIFGDLLTSIMMWFLS